MPPISDETEGSRVSNARTMLLRRLVDIIALPASRISPQNRALAADILIDLLFQLGDRERLLCASRLQDTNEAPRRLLRYLAQCSFRVAEPLLTKNKSYDASDLIDLVRTTSIEHRIAIAERRNVPVSVTDALIETGEIETLRRLLANPGAHLSELGMDQLVQLSRQHESLCTLLAKRMEFLPSQAMAMFWWADGATRRLILTRHAPDRMTLIEQCSDIFSKFKREDYDDPIARKTIQMIERRQRNRAALERSEFESLEAAISFAEAEGITPHIMQEIGYLCGMKPLSTAKLMSDLGGEGMAVLCKATGLKRDNLVSLWRAMRRPVMLDNGRTHPQLDYVLETYDLLSVVKAQTVLRYWNWSLTSSGPVPTAAGNDRSAMDSFSNPRRTAKLVFGS